MQADREQFVTKLSDIIANKFNTNIDDRIKQIELVCYESAMGIHTSKTTSVVYQNLLLKIIRLINDATFADRLINDPDFDVSSIVRLPTYSLGNNAHMTKVRKEIEEKQNAKAAEEFTTDTVECNKCHKRNASYYTLQKRSGDEPATVFYTCKSCGNSWSVNN